MVSEPATNALRHGGGHYTLHLSATTDAANVAISDLNPAPPRERTPDLNDGTGGFGWPMIRRPTGAVTIPRPRTGKDHPRPPHTMTPPARALHRMAVQLGAPRRMTNPRRARPPLTLSRAI
ncbi:ATP-binding protein [Streptomyces sp. 6N106]|uniref:ATP-binding protein n=1 Tax=Streptomyces sp. 6N106 TaxID=3457418 RepID=UPI003FD13D8A